MQKIIIPVHFPSMASRLPAPSPHNPCHHIHHQLQRLFPSSACSFYRCDIVPSILHTTTTSCTTTPLVTTQNWFLTKSAESPCCLMNLLLHSFHLGKVRCPLPVRLWCNCMAEWVRCSTYTTSKYWVSDGGKGGWETGRVEGGAGGAGPQRKRRIDCPPTQAAGQMTKLWLSHYLLRPSRWRPRQHALLVRQHCHIAAGCPAHGQEWNGLEWQHPRGRAGFEMVSTEWSVVVVVFTMVACGVHSVRSIQLWQSCR